MSDQESAHMQGHDGLLSKCSIDINLIWRPLIKKEMITKGAKFNSKALAVFMTIRTLIISSTFKIISQDNSLED